MGRVIVYGAGGWKECCNGLAALHSSHRLLKFESFWGV